MGEPFGKSGACLNCKAERRGILHQRIAENGAESFTWVCSACNRRGCFGTPIFISPEEVRKYLSAEQIEALPVIMPVLQARCAVCGARGTEAHHWAPRAIFGPDECERWPQDYLCRACHEEWHLRVTPQLVKEKP